MSEDYILIGGGLLIALVIMHGLWLAWRARQDPLPLDIESDVPDDDFDVDELDAEFPSDGARVVGREEYTAPTQRPLAFEGPAPVLMEVVDEGETNLRSVDVDVDMDRAETASGSENGTDGNGRGVEPIIAEASDSIAPARISRGLRNEQRSAQRGREAARREARRETRPDPADVATGDEENEVLAINVLARGNRRFNGSDLWAAFQRNGLTFGDMNIFHRLNPVTRTPQYSVANVIEPGTFDLSNMESMKTPGACLFLRLPGPSEPAAVFDDMLRVARDIEQSLDGELKDENFSDLTGQTEEHYRQRIAEFSRKRMSRRY